MDLKRITGKQERLNRLMNIHFSTYFDDLAITATQALALEFIMLKTEQGPVFQKDMEVFLAVRGSSAACLISNLEKNGYIRRETADFDGRYKSLVPTPKALSMKSDISERIGNYIDSLFVGISDSELECFEKVIDKMTENAK